MGTLLWDANAKRSCQTVTMAAQCHPQGRVWEIPCGTRTRSARVIERSQARQRGRWMDTKWRLASSRPWSAFLPVHPWPGVRKLRCCASVLLTLRALLAQVGGNKKGPSYWTTLLYLAPPALGRYPSGVRKLVAERLEFLAHPAGQAPQNKKGDTCVSPF